VLTLGEAVRGPVLSTGTALLNVGVFDLKASPCIETIVVSEVGYFCITSARPIGQQRRIEQKGGGLGILVAADSRDRSNQIDRHSPSPYVPYTCLTSSDTPTLEPDIK
jgi:hypothetical protein